MQNIEQLNVKRRKIEEIRQNINYTNERISLNLSHPKNKNL
jgi:hypothetical protein